MPGVPSLSHSGTPARDCPTLGHAETELPVKEAGGRGGATGFPAQAVA